MGVIYRFFWCHNKAAQFAEAISHEFLFAGLVPWEPCVDDAVAKYGSRLLRMPILRQAEVKLHDAVQNIVMTRDNFREATSTAACRQKSKNSLLLNKFNP